MFDPVSLAQWRRIYARALLVIGDLSAASHQVRCRSEIVQRGSHAPQMASTLEELGDTTLLHIVRPSPADMEERSSSVLPVCRRPADRRLSRALRFAGSSALERLITYFDWKPQVMTQRQAAAEEAKHPRTGTIHRRNGTQR